MKDPRTDAELNRVIGAWCGRQEYVDYNGTFWPLPAYCSDLNAWYQAWMKLAPEQKAECVVCMQSIIMRNLDKETWWFNEDATVRQRAEALVQVIS